MDNVTGSSSYPNVITRILNLESLLSIVFSNSIEIWAELEKLVRSWASKFTTVYAISGAIFDLDADGLRDDDTDQKR